MRTLIEILVQFCDSRQRRHLRHRHPRRDHPAPRHRGGRRSHPHPVARPRPPHRDRRFPRIGACGIAAVTTTAIAAASGHRVSTTAGDLATLSLIICIAVYNRVSKPVTQR